MLILLNPPNLPEAPAHVPNRWELPPSQGAALLSLSFPTLLPGTCSFHKDPNSAAGGHPKEAVGGGGWLWAVWPTLTLVITRSFLM